MTNQQITKIRTDRKEIALYEVGYNPEFKNDEIKMAYGLMVDMNEWFGCDDAEAGYVNEAGEFVAVVALADETLWNEYDENSVAFQGAYIIEGKDYDDYEYEGGQHKDDYVDAEMEAEIVAERDAKDDSAWIVATYC